jgi:hypothetical protein
MSDNRYRPPATDVADVALPPQLTGPALLNVAALLLAGTIAVGFVSYAVQWQFLRSQGSVWFIVLGSAMTTSLIGWLTYKIWKGRNWARIVMLVMFICGTPMSLPQLPAMFSRSPISAVIFVLQTVSQLAALYIVFLTSARHCFKRTVAPNNPLQSTRGNARVMGGVE